MPKPLATFQIRATVRQPELEPGETVELPTNDQVERGVKTELAALLDIEERWITVTSERVDR